MGRIARGSRVKVHYTGKLADGTVFDSSRSGEPFEFIFGEKDLIPGFERAVGDMAPGERKTVTIPAREAYGERRDDLVIRVGKDQLPAEVSIEEGMRLRIKQSGNREIGVVVVAVDDAGVTLDANHPFAGKDLTFELELVSLS